MFATSPVWTEYVSAFGAVVGRCNSLRVDSQVVAEKIDRELARMLTRLATEHLRRVARWRLPSAGLLDLRLGGP